MVSNKPVKKQKLRIVADENISGLDSLCGDWATLQRLPGREISSGSLQSCDVLLVRSVTQVNESLLEGTCLQFVGSATIGVEHIDTDYLASRNIAFAAAPGCNANAVVDYVMAAMAHLVGHASLREKRIGIVGYGNVGSRLHRCLRHFNIACSVYDPYLAGSHAHCNADFNQLLAADIISVHVPLTLAGQYPTQQMFDQKAFAKMREQVLFINSSRGDVVSEQALKQTLIERPAMQAVLDVWQHEPLIDLTLLSRASLASPHIAGYSLAGKLRGSYAIVKALCEHFELAEPPKPQLIDVPSFSGCDTLEEYFEALNARVDLPGLTQQFKKSMQDGEADSGKIFDQYRKNYPLRAEFCYLASGQSAI